jgi:hypothetical protein
MSHPLSSASTVTARMWAGAPWQLLPAVGQVSAAAVGQVRTAAVGQVRTARMVAVADPYALLLQLQLHASLLLLLLLLLGVECLRVGVPWRALMT